MLIHVKILVNHCNSWLVKLTLSKIVISIMQNIDTWKSVKVLELKIHFPNYKILGKKYFISYRNQTECRNVTNELTRTKFRLY